MLLVFDAPFEGPTDHEFATSLAKPQRTLIQQGAIAALAQLKRPIGYLGSVISFGAVVRSYTDEEGVRELVDAMSMRTPSIAVATGDRTYQVTGTTKFQYKSEIDLLVYFASDNQRNAQVGRMELDVTGGQDVHADPGLHIMMEHALELLVGQRLGGSTSIKSVMPYSEQELCTTAAVTVWMQVYRVLTMTTLSEHRTATDLLTSIGWRAAVNPAEVHLPTAPTDSTTIDVTVDLTT